MTTEATTTEEETKTKAKRVNYKAKLTEMVTALSGGRITDPLATTEEVAQEVANTVAAMFRAEIENQHIFLVEKGHGEAASDLRTYWFGESA